MKRINKMAIRPARLALLAVLVAAILAACGGSTTPPGANKVLGSFEGGGYLFLRWREGLEVMIWHDLGGEGTAESAGSATGRLYVERGSAHSTDGRSLSWEVQTVDGTRGEVQIGGARYDLAVGSLFLATTREGAPAVRQLQRDLSAVALDQDAVLAFGRNDPDVAAFVDEARLAALPGVTPTPLPLTATATPSPTATSPQPAPTATPPPPTVTPSPAPAVERIRFAPGATQASIEGYLPAGGRARYVMGMEADQFIEMNAASGTMGQGLRFSIVGADGFVVKPMGEAHVRAAVPSTQDYYVELLSDVGATSYNLSVLIPVRVRFEPGTTSATVAGSLAAEEMRLYVIRAAAGQRMIVAPSTTTGQVRMTISGADGQVLLSGHVGPPGGTFDGILPVSQDYLIDLRAEAGSRADYTLEITIPAGEAEPDITVVGTVMDVSPSARIITLAAPVDGFSVIALTEDGQVISADGAEITLRDVRAGMRIEASGQPGASGVLITDQVTVLTN